MIKRIKIEKIFRNTTKQDGSIYCDKRGKKFILVVIATKGQSGDIKASYCDYDGKTNTWQAGDIVQVDIEKNGNYINFSPPSRLDLLEMRVEAIELQMQGRTQTPASKIEPEIAPIAHDKGRGGEFPLSDIEPPKNEDFEFDNDLPF